MNERIIGLDVGDARIGVAVSDDTRLIASPIEVIQSKGWGPDVKRVCEICRQYDTTVIVSGLPLNMDGTAGFQSQKVRNFCAQLEKAGLTVYYQDERLTTVTATDALIEGNVHRMERKQYVDKVAAAIILQQYLDARRELQAQREKQKEQKEEEAAPMSEENENIVELLDEDNNTVRFEHLATLEYEGNYYICLMPADEADTGDDEGEVVIMQIDQDADGNECYVTVEDDDTTEAVFEKFLELMNAEDDEAEEDDEDETEDGGEN